MINLQHVNVKLFVQGSLNVDLQRFIEIFHGWVANQSLDELLIDVADYRHVPHGPRVMLIGHYAHYAIDDTAGRFGLLYGRKAELEGSNQDRFRQALHAAAVCCSRLEDELGDLKFDRQCFDLIINDRALAPNTAETFAACQPEMESLLRDGLGQSDFKLEHQDDPRWR